MSIVILNKPYCVKQKQRASVARPACVVDGRADKTVSGEGDQRSPLHNPQIAHNRFIYLRYPLMLQKFIQGYLNSSAEIPMERDILKH